MTISIPVAQEMVTTNVTDVTAFFNNLVHQNYPLGTRYQENNNIYENTGADIIVPAYSVAETYTVGQIVFKDSKVSKCTATSGEFPKQPEEYASVDTSFDDSVWDDRYMKIADIPTDTGLLGKYKATRKTLTSDTFLSSDGYRLYELGHSTRTISYSLLTTPYEIETAVFQNEFTTDLSIWTFFISSDGTKLYIAIKESRTIYQYNMGTAWNISTATDIGISKTGASSYIECIRFSADGTKMYEMGLNSGNRIIYQWTLSTAWSLSTATSSGYSLTVTATNIASFYFKSDGLKLYLIANYTGKLHIFNISTAWRISTATDTSTYLSILINLGGYPSITIASTGNRMYLCSTSTNKIHQYAITTAWDILNARYALMPFSHSEVRETITYEYRISESSGVYTFTSLKDGVTASFTPMLTFTELNNSSVEEKAYTGSNGTWLAKTLVIRPTAIYIRTSVDKSIEYKTLTDYQFSVVTSPTELTGFSFIEKTNPYKPFDGKNYSPAQSSTPMTYTVTSTDTFDTLALGRVKAKSITAVFKNASGTVISTQTRDITSPLVSSSICSCYTTQLFYTTEVMEADSTIDITITADTGDTIELGTIMLGISVPAGYANLQLQHKYKDFSVAEYDAWGNLDYVERQKLNTYNGSVDIPITDYDQVIRMMTMIGKRLVIVNGSTSKTITPDSQTVFASTQMIGRFMDFTCRNKISDNDIEQTAEYTFTLEELA